MYLLSFYVPDSHAEQVKTALFKKGAGKIGNYDSCCWSTKGIGQFKPLEGSTPFSGETNQVHRTDETKIELVVEDVHLREVMEELIREHPYEEPAYHAIKINTLNDISIP